MDAISYFEQKNTASKVLPDIKAGDTVTVYYKIVEGNKERIQAYRGVVIQRKGRGTTQTFTVRKISNGVGVERIFPLYSPNIESIEINKRGKVRRAKLYFLRERKGKSAKIREKRVQLEAVPATDASNVDSAN